MYRKHVGRALILALMLSGATSMNAQRITRQFKNVPLKTVLAEVEKELQYSIIYKKDEVNEKKQMVLRLLSWKSRSSCPGRNKTIRYPIRQIELLPKKHL